MTLRSRHAVCRSTKLPTVPSAASLDSRLLGPASSLTAIPPGACASVPNPDDPPGADIWRSLDVCAKIMAALPEPGEDRSEIMGGWIAHAQQSVLIDVGGAVGELIGGFSPTRLECSSDMELAVVMARTVCFSEAAVDAFIAYARVEAEALLRQHWFEVEAVAEALIEKGALTGEEIDQAIIVGKVRATLAEGHARRSSWRAVERRAQAFETPRAMISVGPHTWSDK
jgi:hypothetical protein